MEKQRRGQGSIHMNDLETTLVYSMREICVCVPAEKRNKGRKKPATYVTTVTH